MITHMHEVASSVLLNGLLKTCWRGFHCITRPDVSDRSVAVIYGGENVLIDGDV